MALEIGDIIDGKYEIIRLLGEGGMGAVYEGNNTRIHRRVAIKVLHGNVASNEEAITRFEREAQAAGRIGSEHIVEVLDLGDLPGGDRYMVMEFLEGEALNERIERGKMDPREVAELMVGMLEGLKAAHAAGIIHRDLKPDNVFLLSNRGGHNDYVKIVDFGISKFNTLGGEFSMTRTGAVMGTPYYMAPEQAKGAGAIDHRVDLYAVGVILYQAVVGQVPFEAETFNELLFKIVLETPTPLDIAVPGIDPGFAEIVNKAMSREPDSRFQTAGDFQVGLQSWLGGGYVPAGKTMAGGTPSLDKTQLPPPGAAMMTPATGVAEPSGAPEPVEEAAAGVPVGGGMGFGVKIGVVVAALVAAGGAFLFVSSSGKSEAAPTEDAVDTAYTNEERATALEELQEEKKAAQEARKAAEEARAEAEKNKAELEEKAAEAAARETDEREKAKIARPAIRRPTPAPRPSPTPAPAPRPVPKSGGRPIRTDL